MLKELKIVGEYIYLRSLLLCLTIARDLLGGIIALGYTRSVLLFLVAMAMIVWYLALLTN